MHLDGRVEENCAASSRHLGFEEHENGARHEGHCAKWGSTQWSIQHCFEGLYYQFVHNSQTFGAKKHFFIWAGFNNIGKSFEIGSDKLLSRVLSEYQFLRGCDGFQDTFSTWRRWRTLEQDSDLLAAVFRWADQPRPRSRMREEDAIPVALVFELSHSISIQEQHLPVEHQERLAV